MGRKTHRFTYIASPCPFLCSTPHLLTGRPFSLASNRRPWRSRPALALLAPIAIYLEGHLCLSTEICFEVDSSEIHGEGPSWDRSAQAFFFSFLFFSPLSSFSMCTTPPPLPLHLFICPPQKFDIVSSSLLLHIGAPSFSLGDALSLNSAGQAITFYFILYSSCLYLEKTLDKPS